MGSWEESGLDAFTVPVQVWVILLPRGPGHSGGAIPGHVLKHCFSLTLGCTKGQWTSFYMDLLEVIVSLAEIQCPSGEKVEKHFFFENASGRRAGADSGAVQL